MTDGWVVVTDGWNPGAPGVLRLPSGRLVRGRALRRAPPAGDRPGFAVYLSPRPPAALPWPVRWLRWPDFRTPSDPHEAMVVLHEAWERAAIERVEIGCRGGRGRTGTALAVLAILDGVAPGEAVAYVRAGYHRRAVETPGQRRWVQRLPPTD